MANPPRWLLADNPSPMTLDGTRTYIVGRERPLVIDPGPADARHEQAILAALDGAAPHAILLTHDHPDHAALAPALARRTGAPLLAWPALRDGMEIETEGGALRVLHTPGHTPDHLAFQWGEALMVGDAFMGGMDTVLVAAPEGDLDDYLAMLDRVEALAPGLLYPAHGPPMPGGAAVARRYREHRLQRIQQVVDALSPGPARPLHLVDAIYGTGLHPELRLAAAASIEAVIEHLRRAGRARPLPDGRTSLIQ